MQNGSSKKAIWVIAAAALLFTIPVGLWVKRQGHSQGQSMDTPTAPQAGAQTDEHKEQSPPTAGNATSAQSSTSTSSAENSGTTSGPGAVAVATQLEQKAPPSGKLPAAGTSSTVGAGTGAAASAQSGLSPSSPSSALSASGAKSQQAQSQAQVASKEIEGCFTYSFHHKKTSGHSSDDACGAHKNLVQLKHVIANPSTVCVRVNKRPVAFQTVKGHPDQLLIGAVAGPNSEITVRYCLGKSKCSEDCTVPKDEFMAAIGGSEEELKPNGQRVAQWDPSDNEKDVNVDAHLDKDIRNELEKLDESRPDSHIASVFHDWILGSETPACGTRQAMN